MNFHTGTQQGLNIPGKMRRCFTLPWFIIIGIICIIFEGCLQNHKSDEVRFNVNADAPVNFSAFNFFKDFPGFAKPNRGVISFQLVNLMYNDNSRRDEFIYLPEGRVLSFDSSGFLNIPEGGCLINLIYYYKDVRNPGQGKKLLETQILFRKSTGWETLDYIWNDEQTDAALSTAGGSKAVTWTDNNGFENHIQFYIANKDECKHCHWYANKCVPLGLKEGNLNRDADYSNGKKNQLAAWLETGILQNIPLENSVKYREWKDTTLSLDERARIYLDVNCAFCHNPAGPAFMSHLYLGADNLNMAAYGLCKAVTFWGRATCGLKYDIVPGKPAESGLVCRITSNEIGVRMPELGRTTIDTSGVVLISNWISQMKGGCAEK